MMKKVVSSLLIVFSLVIDSCQSSAENWTLLYGSEDYDLVQYRLNLSQVWMANNFGSKFLSIDLSNGLAAENRIKELHIPGDLSLNVYCLSNENLWVIAGGELLRYSFDIDYWEKLTKANIENFVNCQYLSNDKIIVLGNKDDKNVGVVYERGKEIVEHEFPVFPFDIGQDINGQLWFISPKYGLWKLHGNNEWEFWKPIYGEKIFFTKPNIVWVAQDNFLYNTTIDDFELNKVHEITYELGVSVYEGYDGQVWIVTQSGIWEYTKEEIRKIYQPYNINHLNIVNGFDPGNNMLFLSTEHGVYAVSLK